LRPLKSGHTFAVRTGEAAPKPLKELTTASPLLGIVE